MRAKTNRTLILCLLLATGAVGFFLRRWQLSTAFDEAGLVRSGSPSIWVLSVFALVVTVLAALAAARLDKRSAYRGCFSSGAPEMTVTVLSAALVLAGCVLAMVNGQRTAPVTVLGVAAALAMGAVGLLRGRGTMPVAAVHLIPCVYLIVTLIVDFRRWSVDPTVLDYCFDLFAAIGTVCATVNLMGFCFDKGRRRETVFWCLAGSFFSMVSQGDMGVVRWLTTGGLTLWLLVNGWQLLED